MPKLDKKCSTTLSRAGCRGQSLSWAMQKGWRLQWRCARKWCWQRNWQTSAAMRSKITLTKELLLQSGKNSSKSNLNLQVRRIYLLNQFPCAAVSRILETSTGCVVVINKWSTIALKENSDSARLRSSAMTHHYYLSIHVSISTLHDFRNYPPPRGKTMYLRPLNCTPLERGDQTLKYGF